MKIYIFDMVKFLLFDIYVVLAADVQMVSDGVIKGWKSQHGYSCYNHCANGVIR